MELLEITIHGWWKKSNPFPNNIKYLYRIGGIMVSVLVWGALDRGFKPQLSKTKDYEIGICCFSAKHAALTRKSKDWLARNQNNVSE